MTYLLICCVAGVWGIIFYRFFAAMSAEDEAPVNARVIHKTYFNMTDHAKDPVVLEMDYSDPFGSAYSEPINIPVSSVRNPLPMVAVPVKPQVNWSGIIYSGQIYNRIEKRHVAIISVDGQEVMLSEGEKEKGLKFIKQVGDSIKVEYQNATRYLSIIR